VSDERIAVIGLGYVGLPLAVALAQHGAEIGLMARIHRGRHGQDEDRVAGERRRVVNQRQRARGECRGADLAGAVAARPEVGDPRAVAISRARRLDCVTDIVTVL